MLARLQRYFGEQMAPQEAGDEPSTHAVDLAAAALLIEVARADAAVDEEEFGVIERLLVDTLDLAPEEVGEIVRLAHEEAEEATSLYQFTQLINANYSVAAKRRLMEELWRVAWSDGRLDRYEEALLRRIADLLNLRHSEFMRAKHAVTGEG